jgi:O-antigen/teichoic acid export membrane protein
MLKKEKITKILRWSEKYTRTDMVYFTKGSFWLIAGKISASLLSLITMYAFAKWISKETFGKFQYIESTINILAIIMLPAMGTALVKAIAQGKEGTLAIITKTKIKWSIAALLACLGVSGWYFFQGNSVLGTSFLIASFFFPLPRIFNLYSPYWNGRKRFDVQNKYLIFINTLEALTFIPILILTDNLLFIILAYFISRSIFRGIFFKLTLNKIQNKEIDKKAVPFGKHLTVMETVALFAEQIDKIIIWQFLGPIAVATYSFAKIPIQKTQSLTPFSSLALPKLSQKSFAETKQGLLKKFFRFFLFSIPFALFFIAIIPLGYKLVFPNYTESVPYARALATSLIFIPFSLLNTSLTAAMKTKELYIIKFVGPILKIILFFTLIPIYGIWGIIAGFLASKIVESALIFYLFKKS